MLRLPKTCLAILIFAVALVLSLSHDAAAQDDPNDVPLGDVARNLRRKTPPAKAVIDDDNLSNVMEQAESGHAAGSALKFLMAGDAKGFQISAPDATCSLSFTANAKALLSSQYAQMELPAKEMVKLEGPAAIEGDALTVSVRNRTDWHVSEVSVALTVVRTKSSESALSKVPSADLASPSPFQLDAFAPEAVRPEKKRDLTVIYRMRAAAPPGTMTVCSVRHSIWSCLPATSGTGVSCRRGGTRLKDAFSRPGLAQRPKMPPSPLRPILLRQSSVITLHPHPRCRWRGLSRLLSKVYPQNTSHLSRSLPQDPRARLGADP